MTADIALWPAADDADWLEFHFQRCRPWIEEALAASPLKTHDVQHVWDALNSGECQIWPKAKSVAITRINNYQTGSRVACIWLAGGDLAELKQTHAAIEAFAKDCGCSSVAISGRRGWLKTLRGYREDTTIMVKDLA